MTTYYVRDASGNVMSAYEDNATTFKLIEQPIYGSDRLGIRKEIVVLGESSFSEWIV